MRCGRTKLFLIFFPMYNERGQHRSDVLRQTLAVIPKPGFSDYEILGCRRLRSKDGSAEVVQRFMQDNHVRLVQHPKTSDMEQPWRTGISAGAL